MKKTFIYIFFLIIASNQFVFAQEKNESKKHPILTSKFQLGVGMFIPDQKVKFSVDGSTDNNIIEFDESFDFKNNSVRPQVSFDWRFSKKWNLAAEYFNAGYSKEADLKEDIEAGDYIFKSGSNVKIGYKINLYRIFVGRVISSGLKHELSGGLGFHVMDIGPYIEGEIKVSGNGNELVKELKRTTASLTAPLPNIALWYIYAPTEKWAFTARFDWFGMKIDEFSGSLWDLGPRVHYQIIKNLGVAVDYRYFKINVDVDKEYWNGSANLSFNGPTLTIIGNL